MNFAETMAWLEAHGHEKMRQQNVRSVGGQAQFGVKKADLRAAAKLIKINHELAEELWATANLDAMLLSTLIVKPKLLAAKRVELLVRESGSALIADWVNPYIVKLHPEKEAMRMQWLASDNPFLLRAAWSLTAERAAKSADGLDLPALLDRIERELAAANPLPQWTMNMCLAEIGIHHAEHRERALQIGESLGVYRDYPTPKGCTSPFAPIWISELVRRKEG
jgi:3-methyladenine DNA glycosylase AlkD